MMPLIEGQGVFCKNLQAILWPLMNQVKPQSPPLQDQVESPVCGRLIHFGENRDWVLGGRIDPCRNREGISGIPAPPIRNFHMRLPIELQSLSGMPLGSDRRSDYLAFLTPNGGVQHALVVDFFEVLAGGTCPIATCSDIDFNNNGVFPEDQDIVDFFNVLAGAPCPTADVSLPACDIDFNNNGVFPEDEDVLDFFNVLSGGSC